MTDGEFGQNALITLGASALEVSQQPPAFRHKDQQSPSRRMVFLMCLEVLCQFRDTRCQQCDLDFRRPGVGLMGLVPGDYLPFCFSRQCHLKGYYSCSFSLLVCIRAMVAQHKGRSVETDRWAARFGLNPHYSASDYSGSVMEPAVMELAVAQKSHHRRFNPSSGST
jgi:hypothetical protein